MQLPMRCRTSHYRDVPVQLAETRGEVGNATLLIRFKPLVNRYPWAWPTHCELGEEYDATPLVGALQVP